MKKAMPKLRDQIVKRKVGMKGKKGTSQNKCGFIELIKLSLLITNLMTDQLCHLHLA